MSYYGGDLSSCSSRDDSSSDESETDGYTGRNSSLTPRLGAKDDSSLWARSILYLDIDCFYCQCEEIDRDLRRQTPLRPFAIGQKHIIVTCNYEARKFGVKKLQLREHAMAACPELWIVEGSDLESYRRHSRAVYKSFRSCLQELSSDLRKDTSLGTSAPPLIPAQKACGMDEMMADLTLAIDQMLRDEALPNKVAGKASDRTHIYGEAGTSSVTVLVEDQTGAEAVVSYEKDCRSLRLPESRRNVHQSYGTMRDRQACGTRLRLASQLAAKIRERIREQTGFTTTVGISVSPFLSKIAIIEKPDATNILYPWRSDDLFYSMPLRKLQGVGSRTVRALDKSMERHVPGARPEFWKVR
jgi:DNA polymerase iota